MSRIRTSSFAGGAGGKRFRSFNGSVINDETHPPIADFVKSVCIDDVGKGVDHLLSITHSDLSGIAPLTGEDGVNGAGWYYKYLGWIPDANAAPPSPISGSLLPLPGVVATATLARSNPSRPVVSVPNFLFELKDLPGMIHEIGMLKLLRRYSPKEYYRIAQAEGGSSKFAANRFLSYTMGWQPLISDLRKMFEFRDSVKNRVKDLDVLFNQNGGLHRTVGKARVPSKSNGFKGSPGAWEETNTTSGTVFIDTGNGQLVTCRRDTITTTHMWGSVRWTNPYPKHPRLSHQELEKLARSIIFGLNVTPKEIWDAVPWTWLVDWFANFGDYLDSTNNVLALAPSVPLVMTHMRTEESWTRSDNLKWLTGGNGIRLYETKSRITQGATLSATIPIISGRQFSILGALALQRSR
nr:MAG: putative maturation protein [Leviviridae sp.]